MTVNTAYIKWAITALKNHGYLVKHPMPENILRTAWSEIRRFTTDKGFIYLKKVPTALYVEVNIIKTLKKLLNANVPLIIANNSKYNCFLMQDAGIPLHQFLKSNFQPDIFIEVIQHYTAIQIMSINNVDIFLELGVPNWNLNKLPFLYNQLIDQKNLLLNDGLTQIELQKLRQLSTEFSLLCEQLSQYKIPVTFSHQDFSAKNILINEATNKTTIIDLGEVTITHPFFSLLNCLHTANEIFALTNKQELTLEQQVLKHWQNFESYKNLLEIVAIIRKCWPIHTALGEYRLLQSVKKFKMLRRQGRLAEKLKHWLMYN